MDSEEPAARQARDAALSIEAPCRSSGVGATLGAAVAQAVPTRSTRRWLGAQWSAGISAPRSWLQEAHGTAAQFSVDF